ncbi:hypothetical protein [Chromobacterium violaceum]|uniref:Uncharacterized protein n=1 Tax=Chromobacterium violaceum TaxID=536 RepID=A0AAX2MG36_CHRVL|nr:hypothetical protein [Chromobacterium violaceum]STB69711.1 Uncharacterised protein [Chromobacterium violaceum]SUY93011.1 Uncharacterised protein [Chromobacterium violaceum]
MQVFRNGQPYGFIQDRELIDMLVEQLGAAAGDFTCVCSADEAKTICEEYIVQTYPLWRQVNIMREGSPAERDAMSAFINACRKWSNDPKPDPFALTRIQPPA